MRVGAEVFTPLYGADEDTPIYEQICARRMSRPEDWPWLELPRRIECDYLGVIGPGFEILEWLWLQPSRPVCGAVYRGGGDTANDPRPRWVHHVCLLPPDHRDDMHYAPGYDEAGAFVWPRRRDG